VSELEPTMRELLEAARGADDPTPEERERNRVHLDRRFALLGIAAATLAEGASASASALSASGAAGGVAKLVLVWATLGAAASTVIGGAVMAARPSRPPVAAPAESRTTVVAAAPTRSRWTQARGVAASTVPSSGTPVSTLPEASSSSRQELTLAGEIRSTSAAPRSERAEASAAFDDLGAAAAATRASSVPRTAPDLSLALDVLARAQKQLAGGRPDRALGTLDEFARRAPGAPMGEEREALRIVALCHLDPGRGASEAEQFLRQTARSPLATRVRAACRL
jgi:hypothetical protein